MTENDLKRLIKWADKSPGVTWAGKGGLKERLLHPENFPEDRPFEVES